MSALADFIAASQSLGIFQFYLPFVLAFAIIYGILSQANVFGKEKRGRNINLIVSAILALFIIGATPVGEMSAQFAAYIGTLFSGSVLVVVTIIATMMILYVLLHLVGISIPSKTQNKTWIAALLLVVVLLAVGVFVASGGMAFFPGLSLPGVTLPSTALPALPSIGISLTDVAFILLAVGTVLIIIWLAREGKEEGKG
jgi:hypothetical protein